MADELFARIRALDMPWIWIAPAFGLGLAWAALRWLGKGASPSTSDDYIENFHEQDRRMPLRAVPAKVLASVATLGFGGALGYEGPSIYIGAAAGTWLQRRFRRIFGIEDAKLLMIVGAAAGVAAIFRTPLTGALFAIEVPYQQDQARRAAMPALIGAATSYLTFVLVRGTERVIPVSGQPSFRPVDLARRARRRACCAGRGRAASRCSSGGRRRCTNACRTGRAGRSEAARWRS